MGDRTYGQIFIYDVPADQARALLDVIEADELETNAGYMPHPDPSVPGTFDDLTGKLVIGAPGYHHEEVSVGWMFNDDLSDELVKAAPGATWMAWEDPAYENLGSLRVHVPGLGVYGADCSAGGEAVFYGKTVLDAAGDPERLRGVVGAPWFERIEALRAQLGPGEHLMDVLDPARWPNGDWKTCDVHGGAITQDCDCDPAVAPATS